MPLSQYSLSLDGLSHNDCRAAAVNQEVVGSNLVWGAKFRQRNSLIQLVNELSESPHAELCHGGAALDRQAPHWQVRTSQAASNFSESGEVCRGRGGHAALSGS